MKNLTYKTSTYTASTFLCCLSTLLSFTATAQNELFNAIPTSPLAAIEASTWQFGISNNYSSSDSTWAVDFAESEVFQARLSHQQNNRIFYQYPYLDKNIQ